MGGYLEDLRPVLGMSDRVMHDSDLCGHQLTVNHRASLLSTPTSVTGTSECSHPPYAIIEHRLEALSPVS